MTTDAMTTPPTVSPTVYELDRAWAAVKAGRFRDPSPASDRRPEESATSPLAGRVVTVVGAHGWSGASTTALLIAQTAAEAGDQVRLVDAADPVRSGLLGAAATEHGHDETGHWRRGARGATSGPGRLRLERLDRHAEDPLAVPAAAADEAEALTVVDAGWPLHDLLKLARQPGAQRHWLARLIRSSALVLTARATVPGVQQLGVVAAALEDIRGGGPSPAMPLVAALVGAHRLPRLLKEVVTSSVPAAAADGRLVLLPGRRDLTVQGLTSSDLPRQLTPAGVRLLQLVGYHLNTGSGSPDLDRHRRRGERR